MSVLLCCVVNLSRLMLYARIINHNKQRIIFTLKSCISVHMDLTQKKWLRTSGWILLLLAVQWLCCSGFVSQFNPLWLETPNQKIQILVWVCILNICRHTPTRLSTFSVPWSHRPSADESSLPRWYFPPWSRSFVRWKVSLRDHGVPPDLLLKQ